MLVTILAVVIIQRLKGTNQDTNRSPIERRWFVMKHTLGILRMDITMRMELEVSAILVVLAAKVRFHHVNPETLMWLDGSKLNFVFEAL